MPLYQYRARDKDGALRTGAMEAARKEGVADRLSGMGYIPVMIEEQGPPQASRLDLRAVFGKITPQDLIIFSRQLATLTSSGIPFIQGLITLELQTENPRLKAAISQIRRDIESGISFSDALSRHPKIFSKLYVSLIRVGEAAGILDDILNRLALLAEHEAETRARVKAAVLYPQIVVGVICVAFAFLVTSVIPRFAAVFAQFKTELPLPTRILININYAVQHYWYLVLISIALLAWWVIWYLGTPGGRWQWDGLKLKLPVFGLLFQKVALSRFARIFSAMQKSGISMMQTLEIAGETIGNVVIARAVETMSDSLREGKGLTSPMEATGLFPPMVIQMMAVGEETGQLETMLNKISDYYDMDVDYTIRKLSTLIEPILLLFIGGMVLLLALGIFLPMWNLISLFKR